MKTERRWLKSVIDASTQPLPAMPWARGARRKPSAFEALAAQARQPAATQPRPSLFTAAAPRRNLFAGHSAGLAAR